MKKHFLLFAMILICINSFAQVPVYVDTSGLMAWYPFTGNAYDSSSHLNNGANNGATLTSDRFGNPNSAYAFDGVSSYIDVPNSNSLKKNGQLSISLWFYAYSFPSPVSYFLSKGTDGPPQSWCFDLNALGTGGLSVYDLQSVSHEQDFSNLSQNIWYHIVSVFSGVSKSVYVNGSLMSRSPDTTSLFSNSYDLAIGAMGTPSINAGIYHFNGKLDDIGIWNRALTANEVQQLFTGTATSPCTYVDTIHIAVTDTLIIQTSTGVGNMTRNTLQVYPNPTKDHVIINTGNYTSMSGYSINIVNTLGQTIFQNLINQQTFNLSLSSWATGVYLIEILDSSNNILETKKLILQ